MIALSFQFVWLSQPHRQQLGCQCWYVRQRGYSVCKRLDWW